MSLSVFSLPRYEHTATLRQSGLQAPILSVWSALTICVVVSSFILSQWRLVYTLDDSYIHLAVANVITQGGYGVNLTEYSAPSSSILFPYLLAGMLLMGFGDWSPLIINLTATAITVVFIAKILEEYFVSIFGWWICFFLGIGLLFASSSFALPMTGLEHSVHVAACMSTLYGLIKLAEGKSAPASLIVGIIAMPLLRYEGLAFSFGALLSVLILKRYWLLFLLVIAIFGSYLVFFLFLNSHGLPLLPTSVLLKSHVANALIGQSSLPSTFLANIQKNVQTLANLRYFIFLLILGALLAPKALTFVIWRKRSPEGPVALAVLVAITGHLAGGGFYDWFHRYVVYAYSVGLIAVLFAYRTGLTSRIRTYGFAGAALVLIAFPAFVYGWTAILTPQASRGIFEQQYQMRRFAIDFLRQPVAVNDLGLVSYRNSNFVLDLFGLGSEPVRKAKMAGVFGKEFIQKLTDQSGVGVAMLYESWFPDNLPNQWRKVAQLESEAVTAAGSTVAIFATRDQDVIPVTRALQDFKPTLPERVKLTIF